MTNKYQTIFNDLIKKWPAQINVHEKTLFKNGGAKIRALSDIHDEIEAQLINNESDIDFFQVDWAIYTVMHSLAKSTDVLLIKSITFDMIEEVLTNNLETN